MNTLQSRQQNAVKWANRINSLLASGAVILNECDERVYPFAVREDGDVYETTDSSSCSYIHFINNSNYDNGAELTIDEFDKKFEKWKLIKPEDFIKLTKE